MDAKQIQQQFQIDGNYALAVAASSISFNTILDIGFGNGAASRFFAAFKKSVVAIDIDIKQRNAPLESMREIGIKIIETSFENFQTADKFDAIWMSHILEHTLNVGSFLEKTRSLLKDNGWLFIMVPPFKHEVVGGHLTPGWNVGILMYVLLVSGFDIKNGHFIRHGYNICGFVQKSSGELPHLCHDIGDIEATKDLWPINVHQGFDGNITSVNWFENFPSEAK